MAIALLNSAESSGSGSATLTYALDSGSGSNRRINSASYVTPSVGNVYTKTQYAGNDFTTEFAAIGLGGANKNGHLATYVPSATGSNNIVVTTTTTPTIYSYSAAYSGCSGTDPTGTAYQKTDDTASTSSRTLNPVSITDNSWAFTLAYAVDQTVANGTNFTIQSTVEGVHLGIGDSNGGLGTAGTETVTANTASGNSRWEMGSFVFAPSASTVNSGFFQFF